jgi:hypothetical protein
MFGDARMATRNHWLHWGSKLHRLAVLFRAAWTGGSRGESGLTNKFMIALAACFGFFLIAILGVILLQVSGSYDRAR